MFNLFRAVAADASTPMEAISAQQQQDTVATEVALKDATKIKQQAMLLRNAAADAKRLRLELRKAERVQAEACAELVAAEAEVLALLDRGLDNLTLEPQGTPEPQVPEPQLQFVAEDFPAPPALP
jgi:hypothetical protein